MNGTFSFKKAVRWAWPPGATGKRRTKTSTGDEQTMCCLICFTAVYDVYLKKAPVLYLHVVDRRCCLHSC